MDTQLSIAEVQQLQQLFQTADILEASEIKTATATLENHNGDLDASFNELWSTRVGGPKTYSSQGTSV